MELSNPETRKLFRLLGEKIGEPLDGTGFQLIAEQVTEVSKRFLYDKWKEVEAGSDPIRFQNSKGEPLLNFLGFQGHQAFRAYLENPIPEVLLSCCGTWISLVRQNSFDGYLYQSPVLIYQDQQRVLFKLRGPSYAYGGELSYRNGCLTVIFSGASNKQFHHVYKIGNRKSPKLLQGIYSGISTGNDPIGGRCLLYRVQENFEAIPNRQLQVSHLVADQEELQKAIGTYFEVFERNNLRLNPIIAFDLEDLRNQW